MEGHLRLRIQPWIRRLLTRLMAIVPAFYTILHFGEDALGGLLVLSQVVLSLQLGFAVIPLIHFNSDKATMKEFAIKPWVKIFAWLTAFIIVSLNVQLVIEEIGTWINDTVISIWWIYLLVIPSIIYVFGLLLYVFISPFFKKSQPDSTIVPHGDALEIKEIKPVDYHKIGVTVDFSENDRNTIRHALLQGGKHAEYHLIHIVETAGARFHGEKVLDYETKSDIDNLEKYKSNLEELGYKIEIAIGYGNTAKAICELVKSRELELLVMGTHGHSGFRDLLFGTTLEKVRHRVQIPVLIVK
jgi:manganese transport protein